MSSTLTEVETSPVFVDETGRRGRRMRGAGWVVGVGFVGVTLAMISGLLGTQSDAPSFDVPGTANTLPPGQYVNAPLPSPPGKADRSKGAPHTASATPTGSVTPTASDTADPADSASATVTPKASDSVKPHATDDPPASAPVKNSAGKPSAPPHTAPPASTTPPPPPSGTSSPPASAPAP
ncbi:hypothetical protein OG900_13295 [Streptomyces sp. NBC_00433]